MLDRACAETLDDARELVTFLLERYVRKLESTQRWQAYKAYYAARTPEDEAEERELIADLALAGAEATDAFSS